MKLDVLTREQCEVVRLWRNQDISGLRTPYLLTKEQQEKFYEDVICNPNSPHRYWAIMNGEAENRGAEGFVGMCGITNIQWENRIGEISLIIDPKYRNKGFGEKAVELLFDQAFNHLNLKTVFGECYYNNEAYNFWGNLLPRYGGERTDLPKRKYWQGKYYGSMYFSFDADNFRKSVKE